MSKPARRAPFERLPSRANVAPSTEARQTTDRAPPPPTRWQFGLPALFGTMLLFCLPFAIWGAILRGNENEQLVLTLLCIATPLGVLVIAAMSVSVGRFLRTLRRPKDAEPTHSSDRQSGD